MNYEKELTKLQLLSYKRGTEDGINSAIEAFRAVGADGPANMLESMLEAMLEVWKEQYEKATGITVE
jgi:hypothetical protein